MLAIFSFEDKIGWYRANWETFTVWGKIRSMQYLRLLHWRRFTYYGRNTVISPCGNWFCFYTLNLFSTFSYS